MSRRHTNRTLEHPPAQADPVDHVVEHFADAGVPVWYATKMPYPWESYWWYQWPHAWAEHTLSVAEAAWRNTGARLYATHRDHDLRDDLLSWLLVQAVEVGKDLQPDPWHPAPERQYGKRLYGVLKHRARYHFADVVGTTDHQADKIEREDRRSAYLHPGIAYTSATGTCMVNLCQRPTSTRGLCHNHYAHERQHAIDRGDWQPFQGQDDCQVDGCTRPHGSRGYCNTHYERIRLTGSVELQERPRLSCSHEDHRGPARARQPRVADGRAGPAIAGLPRRLAGGRVRPDPAASPPQAPDRHAPGL